VVAGIYANLPHAQLLLRSIHKRNLQRSVCGFDHGVAGGQLFVLSLGVHYDVEGSHREEELAKVGAIKRTY